MSSDRPQRKYATTNAGLRDALFQELEDLHNGHSTPHEAVAFSKLAGNVLASFEFDLRQEMLDEARKRRERTERLEARQLALVDHSGGFDSTETNNEDCDGVTTAEFTEIEQELSGLPTAS